jgi:TetR/AcrR family transcriptional repressor of bet genes
MNVQLKKSRRMPKIGMRPIRCKQIRQAALKAAAESGIDRVTIRDVADAAGVSTGTVLYYFSDKSGLLIDTLLHVSERIHARGSNGASRGNTPRDALIAWVNALLPIDEELRRDWQVWLSAWNEAVRAEPLRRFIDARIEIWNESISAIARQWNPSLSGREISRFMRDFNAFLNGLCIHLLMLPAPASQSNDIRAALLEFAEMRLGPYGAAERSDDKE